MPWLAGMVAGVLALAGGLLVAAPAEAAAGPHSPVADSYVDASRDTRNYGNRTTLRADASPERISYLKFTVSGSGNPGSALLRVWARSSNTGIAVHTVADTTWTESGITYVNRPALGPVVGTSRGAVSSGTWVDVDVSSAVPGDGTYTLAVTTDDDTALSVDSREGQNPPQLLVPAPAAASRYTIAGSGTSWTATSDTTPSSVISGTLKYVVETAAQDLARTGGGSVVFGAQDYDLGSDHFELNDVDNVVFEGQGIGRTRLMNVTSEATDTEVFDIVHADHLTIRDLEVSAGGPLRSTSDAIDFDDGRNSVVERVKVTGSRGRGIVFDGKGDGWSAYGNLVKDCVIEGVPSDGIELLAVTSTTIQGCTVTDVAGHGIQVTKASSVAATPNKQSGDITVAGNTVLRAGRDGINVNSSYQVRVLDNTVRDSSQASSGRDGVRLESFDGVSCDDNTVDRNALVDGQATPTQTWGLDIASANCSRTFVGQANTFSGNRLGDIQDKGTDTRYADDTEAPSAPTGVSASAVSPVEVSLTWSASSDNIGVTGYTIYRDGAPVGSVDGSTLAFGDVTVAPATDYAYTVDAVDAAGNRSPQSTPPTPVSTPPLSSSVSVGAEADAYVDATHPTTNYGSSTSLRADGSPELLSYVRFVVTGTGPVSSAVLRVRADSNHSLGFAVHRVDDNAWQETTITHAARPTVGGHLGDSGAVTAGEYAEVDVSAWVTGEGVYTFAIVPLNTTNLRMSSRESGFGPELHLTL